MKKEEVTQRKDCIHLCELFQENGSICLRCHLYDDCKKRSMEIEAREKRYH